MAITCTPDSLMATASCFNCFDEKSLEAIETYLYCQIANHAGPVPITPTNLDIDPTGVTSDLSTFFAKLTWQDVEVPTSFEIWRQVNANPYALLATVAGSVLTYSDNCTTQLLMPDFTVHTYKVRAKTGTQFSPFSNEIQVNKGSIFNNDLVTVTLSYPLLVLAFFEITVDSNTALTSVSFPKLKAAVNHLLITNNQNLTSFSAPIPTRCGFAPAHEQWGWDGNNLTTLNLSALVNIDSVALTGGSNPGLTTITFNANPIIPDVGNSIIFDSCALNAATVNRILAIGVANGLTQAFIKLDGGTNAAPSGQGIADKATLIGNGCTVVTN